MAGIGLMWAPGAWADDSSSGNAQIALLTDCADQRACYADGYHLFKDGLKAEAAREWQTGCARGDAKSCEWSALAYAQSGDSVSARPLNKVSCERYAISSACFYYGWALADGIGGSADPVAGRILLEPICERGPKHQAAACQTLGKLHYEGKGVAEDWVTARSLMSKACDLGNSTGCFNLGVVTASPINAMTHNPAASSSAFARACDLGLANACDRVAVSAK